VPGDAIVMNQHRQLVWTVGQWGDTEAQTAQGAHRTVTVFGPCSASQSEIQRMADHGVSDLAQSIFAGSYTVVESTDTMTAVHCDVGHAQPVYVASAPQKSTAWASSSLTLAALIGAQPDPTWLADMLLPPYHSGLSAGRSAFTGIATIAPAHRLVVAGKFWESRRCWLPPAADRSLEEGAPALRAALERAVRVRVEGRRAWSADCSGGLDSTTLALLAINNAPTGSRGSAVTIHPEGVTEGGDLGYARAATRPHPRLKHVLCPLTTQQLPYSRMAQLIVATDEPAPGTVTLARTVAEFKLLHDIDATDCHFIGDGGDTLLGGHPDDLAELARSRHWPLFIQHSMGWARLHRTAVWPLVRTAITDQHRAAQRTPGWATEHAREARLDKEDVLGVGYDRTLEAIRVVGRTARADIQIAEQYGIRIHNPFTDSQVIQAALAVPSHRRANPYHYKALLSQAASQILPASVAHRCSKGDFTPDHYLGLRANFAEINELVDGRLAELDLVRPSGLRRILSHAASGMPVAFSEFEPVIAAEVWLRATDAALRQMTWRRVRNGGREPA
jgi:asparagine synthase (glutamine-hydrolysing)